MTRQWTNGWGIESTRFYSLDMVSCKIVTRNTGTPLVSAYLSPSTLEHLPDFEEAPQTYKGLNPIVLGVLTVDLDEAWSSQSQRVAGLLIDFGLIDLFRNVQQRCHFRDLKTWTQVRQGTVLRLR